MRPGSWREKSEWDTCSLTGGNVRLKALLRSSRTPDRKMSMRGVTLWCREVLR